MKYYSILIIILFLFQCKTQENKNTSTQNTEIKQIPMVDDNYRSQISPDESMTLYYKMEQTPSDPATHFEYYVQDNKSKKFIYQGKFRGENIAWHNNESLVLTPYVGIIQKPNDDLSIENNKNQKNTNYEIIKIK